jgi:hypothetical protein
MSVIIFIEKCFLLLLALSIGFNFLTNKKYNKKYVIVFIIRILVAYYI